MISYPLLDLLIIDVHYLFIYIFYKSPSTHIFIKKLINLDKLNLKLFLSFFTSSKTIISGDVIMS